jgi:uncharacterized protein involved in cysteine biosynthesis
MRYLVRGFGILARNRHLWKYLVRPVLLSGLVFLAIVATGYVILVPRVADLLAGLGVPGWLSTGGATLLYAVLWLFLSGIVFLGIASLFSSLMWDGLSMEVERLEFGDPGGEPARWPVALGDIIRRGAFSLTVAALGIGCGWVLFGSVAVFLTGVLGLFDYTASAYLRRGISFPEQMARVGRCPGWAGFMLVAGVVTLIPFVNVLMLPAMVAGGTLMAAESERG